MKSSRLSFSLLYISVNNTEIAHYVKLYPVLSKLQIMQVNLAGLEESFNYSNQKILELEEVSLMGVTASPTKAKQKKEAKR